MDQNLIVSSGMRSYEFKSTGTFALAGSFVSDTSQSARDKADCSKYFQKITLVKDPY